MKHKRIIFSSLFFLCLGLIRLQAQEAIPASGGNALGISGSVSYSIGQITYSANTGASGIESQGVQQPYEILVITGIEAWEVTLQCAVFPNPTTDFLYLKVENFSHSNFSYQLFDIQGKLIETNKVDGNLTGISMRSLPSENYILKVISGEKAIKTFKIIKK